VKEMTFEENLQWKRIDDFSHARFESITIPNSVEIIDESAFVTTSDSGKGGTLLPWSFLR
jgi:hypothetical protein